VVEKETFWLQLHEALSLRSLYGSLLSITALAPVFQASEVIFTLSISLRIVFLWLFASWDVLDTHPRLFLKKLLSHGSSPACNRSFQNQFRASKKMKFFSSLWKIVSWTRGRLWVCSPSTSWSHWRLARPLLKWALQQWVILLKRELASLFNFTFWYWSSPEEQVSGIIDLPNKKIIRNISVLN